MRTITNKVANAFANNHNFKNGHDVVTVNGTNVKMSYRGNVIAEKINNKLIISSCGWQTNTTKERLNGISGVNIKQIKGVWYLNGNEWNGKPIEVIN